MKPAILACISIGLILFHQTSTAQLSPQQQKNLTAFTRLYGYTRYFHPSDEAAALDWDKFAIYGAGKVLTAKDDRALIATLRELFHPIAPTVVIFPEEEKDTFSRASITPPDTSGYLPITWQHFGLGISNGSAYKSIRINRPLPDNTNKQALAAVSQVFSAHDLQGKEFRLSAWMKVDSTRGGEGHLWIRITEKGKVVFFYAMNKSPATSNTWKEYSFTGRASKDADLVMLGAWLANKGAMFLDHVQLSVKEGDDWTPVPLDNGGFETDSGGVSRAWRYDIKQAAYRIASETSDVHEGHRAMSIVSIKDTSSNSLPVAQSIFEKFPAPGEYIRQTLTRGIACIVPLSLYGTKQNTWPVGDSTALSRLELAINATPSSGDALAVRLGDLAISWNIFRHFFPYWEDASATPDQLLEKALTKAGADKDRYDFLQTLRLLTAPLNDGHIRVSMTGDTTKAYFAPIKLTVAEDRLVIERVLDSSLQSSLSPGDVISAIDGQPAADYTANIIRTLSGSPQLKVFLTLNQLISGPRNSSLTLAIETKTGVRTVTIPRSGNWSNSFYVTGAPKHPSGWIKPGVFYIDLDRDPMDSINAWMPLLVKARAIICDLRGYPKNNHGLINHLLTVKEDTKWMWVPKIIYPDYQQVSYNGGGWNMAPAAPHLDGKIFFLTDGSAISYAETYMGFIKDFHLATIVGQPTAGTNGNVNPFILPGGYNISWTGMLVKDHNGGKHHLKGIVPDVPVQRTLKGIREGRDEFLDKALDLAGDK